MIEQCGTHVNETLVAQLPITLKSHSHSPLGERDLRGHGE
jgi:hypothetical protein